MSGKCNPLCPRHHYYLQPRARISSCDKGFFFTAINFGTLPWRISIEDAQLPNDHGPQCGNAHGRDTEHRSGESLSISFPELIVGAIVNPVSKADGRGLSNISGEGMIKPITIFYEHTRGRSLPASHPQTPQCSILATLLDI